MFSRLLLTLDGSELARVAIQPARELAERFHAAVYVLQVMPKLDGPAPFSIEGTRIADERAARADVERAAADLRDVAEAVEPLVVEGHAGESIVEQAEVLGCDTIVMATHGRSGVGRVLLGSVAEHVVRHSRGSTVVLVRPDGVVGRPTA